MIRNALVLVTIVVVLIGISACVSPLPDPSVDPSAQDLSSGPLVIEAESLAASGTPSVVDPDASGGSALLISDPSADIDVPFDASIEPIMVSLRMRGASASEDAVYLVTDGIDHRVYPSQHGAYEWLTVAVDTPLTSISLRGAEPNVHIDVIVLSAEQLTRGQLDDLVGTTTHVPVDPAAGGSEGGSTPAVDIPTGEYTLIADQDYRSKLTSMERTYHDAALADARFSLLTFAHSDDLYDYGRRVNLEATALMLDLRVSHDPADVDELVALWNAMDSELADAWRDGTTDGYVNWQWLHDSSSTRYYGKDNHPMDEMMTHGFLAEMLYIFEINKDLDPTYAKAASSLHDYLFENWESKWRDRNHKGPNEYDFITKDLTHPSENFVRYLYYTSLITNEQGRLDYAQQLFDEINAGHAIVSSPNGPAEVWCHGLIDSSLGCYSMKKSNYFRYDISVYTDLYLDGYGPYHDDQRMTRIANSLSQFVIDGGSPVMAEDISGYSQAISDETGFPLSSDVARNSIDRFGPDALLMVWDDTGELRQTTLDGYDSISEAEWRMPFDAALLFDASRS